MYDKNISYDSNLEKVVLVTGSTSGIGKVIVLELAKMGFSVVINEEAAENISKIYINELREIYHNNLEEKYLYIRADISKTEDRAKLINEISTKFNRIDILINNAGTSPRSRNDILNATEESFDWVLSINLKGPYFLTQAIANWMITLRESIPEGYQPYIVNISSISSFTSSPNRGEYCISKAGVSMMTKLYADRLSEYDIPVFEISPGIVETPMTAGVKEKYDKLIDDGLTPIKRWGKPIDIAKTIVAIVSGLLPFSTGMVLNVDGGFHLHRL